MSYNIILPAGYNPPSLPGRDEWLKALRSGEYAQGQGALQEDVQERQLHCCLGVLCVIQNRPKHRDIAGRTEFDGTTGYLARANPAYETLIGAGNFPAGVVVEVGTERIFTLAYANDQGLTFLEIADIIEKVWSNAEKNW